MSSKKKNPGLSLVKEFEKQLLSSAQILRGDTVWVACSGGPDSVALFHLLRLLRVSWKLSLGLLYFHHGLRPREADHEALFVRNLALHWNVPFEQSRTRILAKTARRQKASIEEQARVLRYAFFERVIRKRRIRCLALGHTLDDQAETVLMRVLKGTGLQGLCAIRPERELAGARLIRPLLGIRKGVLLVWLKENGFEWCRDSSNDSPEFLRNRIRSHLLPGIEKEINPRVQEALARLPAILSEDALALEQTALSAYKRIRTLRRRDRVYLDRQGFDALAPALGFRVLNAALKDIDEQSGLSFEAWQRLRPRLGLRRDTHSLPRDLDVALTPSRMIIYRKRTRRLKRAS